MHTSAKQDPQIAQAAKRVAHKLAFFGHLLTYLLVNIVLIGINLLTTPHYFWAGWAIFGWGIGLLCHALKTFALDVNTGLHQRMMARELQRLQRPE